MKMKRIAVTRLHKNPDRDFDRNPMDEEHIESLMSSIEQNDFWHGIIVRPHGDDYQMAFGHNRIEAAKRLGIKEVEVDVTDLTDAQMLQRLDAENCNQNGRSPAASLETVIAAKRHLDEWLQESDTAEEFCEKANISQPSPGTGGIFQRGAEWTKTKNTGVVGRDIVRAFLPKGKSDEELSTGINIVNAEYAKDEAVVEEKEATDSGDTQKAEQAKEKREQAEQDVAYRDIIELFPHMRNATTYVRELKKREESGKPLPKADQIKFANRLVNDGTGKRDIPRVLSELVDGAEAWAKQEKARLKKQIGQDTKSNKTEEKTSAKKNWKEEWKRRHSTTPDEYMRDVMGAMSKLELALDELAPVIEYSEDQETLTAFLSNLARIVEKGRAYTAGLSADTFQEVN